jgi:8-oxo-dGTP diphosphatase
VEVYLAGLICAAAREEAREDDAITSWANNLSLVRCKNLDIPPESDANAAIRKAVHLARDSGLNIKWHALDRFLAAAQDHFVLPLVGIATGLALAPLGGPLLTMQVSEQIVEQMARPFADSLTERIRTTITESDTFRIRAARRGAERLFAVTNADLRAKGYTNESRCAVVILVDNLKNIMLYLRDNKSNIPFPNTWGLLGGLLKEEETPEDGIRRELREELGLRGGSGYELRECKFLFTYPRKDITRMEYVFRALLTERIENLTLHEGQRLELFCQSKIECVDNIVPHHREILLRYFECV